ncbi:zinc metalloprotease [Moniliophthora roreri]|nr:zinc metalloprotease [Moniliophthora roreri]
MATTMDWNHPDLCFSFFSISNYHHEPTIPHVYICFDQQMVNGQRTRTSIHALLFHHGHKDEGKEAADKDLEQENRKEENSGKEVKEGKQKPGLEIHPTTYHQVSQSSSYYDEFSPTANLDALSVDSDGESLLLDDDPFADLSSPPASPRSPSIPLPPHPTQSTIPKRHSPLSPIASKFSESHVQLLPTPKQKSLGTKASLPTLKTLAELSVVIPKKTRKGKVGANLPLDPWETEAKSLSNDSGTIVIAPARPPLIHHRSSHSISNLLELALHHNTNTPRENKRSSSHFGSLFRKDKRKNGPIPPQSPRSEPSATITTTPPTPTTESSSSSSDFTSDGASTTFTSPALSENEDELESKQQLHRRYWTTDEQQLPSYDKFNRPPPLSLDSPEREVAYLSPNSPSPDILEGDNYLSLKNWASDATLRLPSPGRPLKKTPKSSMDVNFGHDDDDQYDFKGEHFYGDDERSTFSHSCSSRSSSSHSHSVSGDSHSHECCSTDGSSSGRVSVEHGHDDAASQHSQYSYEEPVDGDGEQGRSGYSGYNGYLSYGASNGHSASGYSQSRSGRGYSGLNGRSYGHGGDDEEDPYDSRRPSMFDSTSDSESEEEEEDSDDDVPLAQSHPAALQAQQSILMKDRQRRRERKLHEQNARSSPLPPSPLPPSSNEMSSSQEAAALALAQAVPPQPKPEPAIEPGTMLGDTTTLPSSLPAGTVRLRTQRGRTRTNTISNGVPPPNLQQAVAPPPPPMPTMEKTLRPMRSFHRPQSHNEVEYNHTSLDRSRSQRVQSQQQQFCDQVPAVPPLPSTRARSRSRPPAVRAAVDEFGAMSLGSGVNEMPSRKSTDLPPPRKSTDTIGSRRSGRSSMDHNRPDGLEVPPVELMPALPANLKTTQRRIYIGDRQRFVVIETNQQTNAGEVIDTLERRGELKDWRGTGGWMLWEVAQDFGIERPMRSFELLSDVEASWNRDKTVNVWMVRLTPWKPVLSRSALPSSSPICSGYVEYEVRRGKWSKRWLVLREHCLYISKRDNCKDEQLLCALSNFDAYHTTRLLKAPKEYTFAIKSTEKMSLFEDTSDYMHLFSCKTRDGEKWMEKILLARSYVLYQERHVLFAPKTASGVVPTSLTGGGAGASLSRAPTKRRPMPDKPLLQVGGNDVFAPGSLLRGQVGQ